MPEDRTDRFLTSINQGYDAMLDALRAGNERTYRASKILIDEAQTGQRELVDLGRRWAEAPLDVIGFSTALVESLTRSQGRMLDLTRIWFDEMAQVQKESRDVIQRVTSASRTTVEVAVETGRSLFSRATEEVRSAARAGVRSTRRDGETPQETAATA
ncbi:MAG: hypothetical protein HYS09_10205 [Chloroflexi bacterium]|nr:hypothetical protein [Chloroflexota bacterium]